MDSSVVRMDFVVRTDSSGVGSQEELAEVCHLFHKDYSNSGRYGVNYLQWPILRAK